MSKYEDALIQWSDNMSEFYFQSIKEILKEDLNESVVIDIATSLAHDYINTNDSQFFLIWGLTEDHAYCYLNEALGNYEKEVEDAFDKDFQSAKEDGELSSYESSLDDDRE